MTELEKIQKTHFDLCIVGSGLAGLLAAMRLSSLYPEWQILLLEKEKTLMGRLRQNNPSQNIWSTGLDWVSKDLADFLENTLHLDPEARELKNFKLKKQESFACLLGQNLKTLSCEDFFADKGIQMLGGRTVLKKWHEFKDLLEKAKEADFLPARSLGKLMKLTKKDPFLLSLSHLLKALGLLNPLDLSLRAIAERMEYYKGGLLHLAWDHLGAEILELRSLKDLVSSLLDCTLLSVLKKEDSWQLTSSKGVFKSRKLLFACSPWQALDCLPREDFPQKILELALKVRPQSCLSYHLQLEEEIALLSDSCLIPAEHCQAQYEPAGKSLNLLTQLEFERSLDAPLVVQAVRKLKRAHKKLEKVFPELKVSQTHLALISVAWGNSGLLRDERFLDRLKDLASSFSNELAFCGDLYGTSYDPDKNLKSSVLAACEALAGGEA